MPTGLGEKNIPQSRHRVPARAWMRIEPFAEFRTPTREKYSAASPKSFAYSWMPKLTLHPHVCKTFRTSPFFKSQFSKFREWPQAHSHGLGDLGLGVMVLWCKLWPSSQSSFRHSAIWMRSRFSPGHTYTWVDIRCRHPLQLFYDCSPIINIGNNIDYFDIT